MLEKVTVYAPATVANVGCAFDVLGCALAEPGDELTVRPTSNPGVTISNITGDSGRLPINPEENTAGVAASAFLKHIEASQGIEIELHKKMPLGSGLGSSAASSVAAVFAANKLFGSPLSSTELLPFTIEGEKQACGAAHADNVAPALLGGFVLIRSSSPLDIVGIPSPSELTCTVVHPLIEINTGDARKILRKEILLSEAVKQWGNIAGLIAGLINEDYELIGRSLEDHIIEPIRSIIIPGFSDVKEAALSCGALGCSISGSGPSMFAFSRGIDQAKKIGQAMQAAFEKLEVSSTVYASKINSEGPRIIESS